MRTLSAHEKKLTLFLALALLAGVHLIALKVLLSLQQGQQRRLQQARDSLTEAQFWIGQKEAWEEKTRWLEEHLQPVPEANPAPALQMAAQAAAERAQLKIEEQTLRSPKSQGAATLYSNRMRLSGSLEQFLRWLTEVYQPDKAIAVTALQLKIGGEPPKMAGEAEVSQFYRQTDKP